MPISGDIAVPITVVLPAYNAQDTVGACLESIRQQSFPGFEIILVNDGSTDQTGAIFDQFAREDRRARVLHIVNAGVAAARNRGLDMATGDFIFFIDADDRISPEALSLLFQAQQSSGAPVVIGGFDRYGREPMNSPDGLVFAGNRELRLPEICSYVCKYLDRPNKNPLFVFSWGRLISRQILNAAGIRFQEDLKLMEDVKFNFDLLRQIDKLYYVSRRIYHYQVYNSVASQSFRAVADPKGLTAFAPALESARAFLLEQCQDPQWSARWVGQAYVTYTIIHLLRLCVQCTPKRLASTLRCCRELVALPALQESLRGYVAARGDSRIIPFLLARRYVGWVMVFGCYKAWRRYGRSRYGRA